MAIQQPSITTDETPSLSYDLNKLSCELAGLRSLVRYMEDVHQDDGPMLNEALFALNAHLSHLADRASLAVEQAEKLERAAP